MKQFDQFRKDIDEAVAAVTALPKIVSVASKVAPQIPKFAKFASGALKFGSSIPVGLRIANVLQSRGDGESNFDKLANQQKGGEAEDLSKKVESKLSKKRRRKRDAFGNIVRDALSDIRTGLSAGKDIESTSSTGRISSSPSDEFREKEGGRSPADVVRDLLRKQKEQYKRERERNKRNELP